MAQEHEDAAAPVGLDQPEPRLERSDERFRLLVESLQDYAVFMLTPQGNIATWNPGAERIKGYRAEEIVGQHFSVFYPPEAVYRGWPEHELKMAAQRGRFEDEGWRLRKDGTRFWANVVITALRAEDGTLLGFAKVTRDLTERRRHEEELRQSEELFRLMVDAVQDYAIFMLDPDGRVASWNSGARRIKGYAPEDIIGKYFGVFYPAEALARGWPEHELAVARQEGRFEDEGWRLRQDGTRFWASVVITAVHDEQGRLRGFAKVTRDVTERRRVEALEAAGRQTTEFLAMLAHELRNPLAPIRNALAVLQMDSVAPDKQAWARGVIDRQLTHLTRLVDDLLDLSRITSGKITLHCEVMDLRDAVSRAIDASQPLIESRRHSLEVALPREPVRVSADLTRLVQVLTNLLNNAAKYTPEGGVIHVSAAAAGDLALVRVRDTGIGLAPDLLPRVFDLFIQGDRGLDRSEGGLGIGLTLVDRLVRLHGGTVSASSPGPGKGSEFVVRLPLAHSAAGEAPVAGAEARTHHGRRVLVVDDNLDSAESMCLLLELWGHRARVARNADEALTRALEMRPDLVLLDIGLPGIDGFEVARLMRSRPELAHTTLVAMTGYGHDDDRQRSREAGFASHLVKPVATAELQGVLASLPPRDASD
jgi:PAS domain S-box-containing protein